MARDEQVDRGRDVADRKTPKKRPYAKPRLQEYGSIAKLTQSGGTTKNETGGMMSCL